MNPDQPTSKPPYQPNLALRLLLWFGIYIGAQLPLLPYRQDWSWFPMGLLDPFVHLLNKIRGTDTAPPAWALHATYAFYAIHFVASLVVRRRKAFQILIWILLALVIFNLGGCELDQHLH